MTKEEAIKDLKENICSLCAYGSQNMESCDIRGCDTKNAIKTLESQDDWIPIKWHNITEEERESEGYPEEWLTLFDCALPDDEETVLVTNRYGDVEKAVFVSDADGCYFEEYEEDGDVLAWMPLPKGYEPQGSEE